jgi:hypothetical protein
MYFKLDYLELLGKHWLLNRAPMLGDWRSSAGLERRWIGAAEIAGESPQTQGRTARSLGFPSYRRGFPWADCAKTVLETGKQGIRGWDWRGKRCNDAVTGNCWPDLVQHKWAYWLSWASSIIGSPGLLIYKLYIYIYIYINASLQTGTFIRTFNPYVDLSNKLEFKNLNLKWWKKSKSE